MPFAKPENALKRAEEFINVGKQQRALDTLYEVIRSKRNRTWTKIHEVIMKSYLTLCVELKESHMAKDGLHQYKTICQNVNVKSLEDVINGFLQMAEEKAEKAKKDANDANIVDVDDLENLNSPESLLLKAVSGESSQDRADRDLLAPWLKFVWESYKQCLELLKNNNKVEQLYQQVAKLAFSFCVKYQRKTEFRKLCETIRQHMVQSQKYQNQATSIDLNKPETQNNYLETRLFQLNHAISMELWQEAYKAVEDIYGLMSLSRTKPKPGQMFNYYSKLSMIFWKAGNYLFHAATLQKLFVLLKEQKKTITQEELTKISTRLLLATLAIPIPPNRSSIDECLDQDEVTQEKLKRLSSLLNLQQPPTRLSLLKDLAKYNVVQHVFPEVKDLYKWLELEFHPLKLSERVTKCLDFIESKHDLINENYVQYIQAIKEIAVTRLVKQISQIYTSIEIKRFVRLAPQGIDTFHLEKLIVDAAKQLDLQVRINHQTKSLHFGNDLYVAQKEDLPEGPHIQSMPSEQIRNQLITMSGALQQAQELIYGGENKKVRDKLSNSIADVYRQTCVAHHANLLKRKQLIEEQKEMYERIASEREQAEKEEKEKRQKQEERERMLTSTNNMKNLKDSLFKGDRLGLDLNDDELMNEKDDEVKQQIEKAKRELKELTERLKKEEKKFDHVVRACYEVEIPMRIKLGEEDAVNRKKFWEEKEVERIEDLKKEQQIQAENRERLLRMVVDKDAFEKIIHSARKEEYEKRLAEFSAKLTAARELKLSERKEKRKVERRTAYFKEIEDRKKREEDEKRMKEDEERRRKQEEQAEKQRKREREIEEKMERERQQAELMSGGGGGGNDGPSQHLQQRDRDRDHREPTGGAYKPRAAGGAGFGGGGGEKTMVGGGGETGEGSWRKANAPASDENASDRQQGYKRSERGSHFGGGSDGRDRDGYAARLTNRSENVNERRVEKSGGEDVWRKTGGGGGNDDERGGGAGGGRGGYNRDERNRDGGGRGGLSGSGPRGGGVGGPGAKPNQNKFSGAGESKADSSDNWRRGDQ